MPYEIFESATSPERVLCWRYRTLLKDISHEAPALEIAQLCEVTEHATEIHPHEWIDARNIGAPKAKIDSSGTGFERRGRIVEGRSADTEHANAFSIKSAEIDVIGRMGITLRGQLRDESPRSPPGS